MYSYFFYYQRLVAAMLLLSTSSMSANATFSIVATDKKTRQVGGAGASCNPSGDIFSGLYVSAPNRSVLHTQALLLERSSPIVWKARDMMRRNESIDDILSTMEEMEEGENYTLSVGSFPSAELRQYGMANFVTNGGYTGQSLETVYELAGMAAGAEQIDLGSDDLLHSRFSYHAMGNDVAEGTVAALQTGFLTQTDGSSSDNNDDDDHCIMARRLMASMESVLEDEFGDMRCINDHNGISATGAYLHIDNPDGRVLIHINKAGDGSYEPIEELKREFIQWQETNGCVVDSLVQDDAFAATESGSHVNLDTTSAETHSTTTETDSSKNGMTNKLSTLAIIVVVGLVSAISLTTVAIAHWRGRLYTKQKLPDAEAIIEVDEHVWGV